MIFRFVKVVVNMYILFVLFALAASLQLYVSREPLAGCGCELLNNVEPDDCTFVADCEGLIFNSEIMLRIEGNSWVIANCTGIGSGEPSNFFTPVDCGTDVCDNGGVFVAQNGSATPAYFALQSCFPDTVSGSDSSSSSPSSVLNSVF